MKTTTRCTICFPIAAMILTAALATPAAAQTKVPFKGSFQGNDTIAAPTITTSGTGNASLVGKVSLTNTLTLTSQSGGTGTGHWVAANGDTIDTTFVASGLPSDDFLIVTEVHTITGGNGSIRGNPGNHDGASQARPDTQQRWNTLHLGLVRGEHYSSGCCPLRVTRRRACWLRKPQALSGGLVITRRDSGDSG